MSGSRPREHAPPRAARRGRAVLVSSSFSSAAAVTLVALWLTVGRAAPPLPAAWGARRRGRGATGVVDVLVGSGLRDGPGDTPGWCPGCSM